MPVHSLKALTLKDKNVLLRLDLDLPPSDIEPSGFDTTRLDSGLQTLNFILKRGAKKVHVIGHFGRPDGKVVKKYSLQKINQLLLEKVAANARDRVSFGENLRFDPGEEGNSKAFAKKLAKGFDFYVNDAFATAHRNHASMVQLPQLLPTVMGREFEREMKVLQKLYRRPDRPVLIILGGAKEDKLEYVDRLFEYANVIILAGKLASLVNKAELEKQNRKLIAAELNQDGLDVDKDSKEQIERFIKASSTVIWNGPVGKYDDPAGEEGTRYLAESMSKTKLFSVIGGGDTEAALDYFKIDRRKFSHISTGGGALMEYLCEGELPAYTAIEEGQKQFSWEKYLQFVA